MNPATNQTIIDDFERERRLAMRIKEALVLLGVPYTSDTFEIVRKLCGETAAQAVSDMFDQGLIQAGNEIEVGHSREIQ